MEELGLLEHVIPILATHLKSRGATLAEQPAVRNMAALGRAIGSGLSPDHSIVLAALMLDLYRDEHRRERGDTRRVDILGELRARGFARGDTEQMRLILEAFANLASPTRRTRRLMRRPYFPDARMFFEMTAPTYSIDPMRTLHFLADPDAFNASPARIGPDAPATHPDGAPIPAGNRRRRRRRRRRPRHGAAADMNGASTSLTSLDPERRDKLPEPID
jgi:hypothetical protein